jgi:hypothetical protein
MVLNALPTGNIYKWATAVTVPTALTLDCSSNPNAVFVFQIAQGLTVSASVTLNECLPQNIFWVVGGITTLESGVSFSGIILDQTQIIFDSGATLNGEALAQSQVTLIANTITAPAIVVPLPVPTPSPNPIPIPVGSCVDPVYSYYVGTTFVGTGTHAAYQGPNIQLTVGGPIYGGSNVSATFDYVPPC